ncbi:MAG: hypothetical protein ACLFQU_09435 [Candidatus Kapaibacterium sp.]
MKKLIAIILVLGGMTAWATEQGSGHNPTETAGPCTMTTNCIAPFLVWNDQPQNPDDLPDVIKGQTWTGSTPFAIFAMTKAANYTVRLNLDFDDNPVDGVTLDGAWGFNDQMPEWDGSFPITNTLFDWYGAQTEGWIIFNVTEIDATNATSTGVRTFNVSVSGHYHNI